MGIKCTVVAWKAIARTSHRAHIGNGHKHQFRTKRFDFKLVKRCTLIRLGLNIFIITFKVVFVRNFATTYVTTHVNLMIAHFYPACVATFTFVTVNKMSMYKTNSPLSDLMVRTQTNASQ